MSQRLVPVSQCLTLPGLVFAPMSGAPKAATTSLFEALLRYEKACHTCIFPPLPKCPPPTPQKKHASLIRDLSAFTCVSRSIVSLCFFVSARRCLHVDGIRADQIRSDQIR